MGHTLRVTMLRATAIVACFSCLFLMDLSEAQDSSDSAPPMQVSSARLLDLGKLTYTKKCVACHGELGAGDGEAAYLLYPKPRDFVTARYRLVSTWNRVPTDQDLFATITRGMPGSAMPSWAHLPEDTRWGLVHYIKSLSAKPFVIGPSVEPEDDGESGSGVVVIPAAPAYDDEAHKRADALYQENCAGCHGKTGRGDGATEQIDDEGYATRPRDLTQGVYKGSPDPASVYLRIVAGMPGTPMPMTDWARGDDGWHLTHYVLAMSSERERDRNEMHRYPIVATRVDALPEHPDSGLWGLTPPVNLHLMPLWWRDDRPQEITVRALHDGDDLAVLAMWPDDSDDHTMIRTQDFRDAVAIQFSLTPDPPFFGMGDEGNFVNIWMWKSERQADLDSAFQDLEEVYPNIAIDSYTDLKRSPLEQPTRHAPTLESDPVFVTGWGAGNIVSDPTRDDAAEDLRAKGFGTLSARPPIDRSVEADGVYRANAYSVMFRRSLDARGKEAVSLRPGKTVPVAFAVWNGSAGDRDGKKSITIWQDLVIER